MQTYLLEFVEQEGHLRAAGSSRQRPLLGSAGFGEKRRTPTKVVVRTEAIRLAAAAAMTGVVGEEGFRPIIWAVLLGHQYRPIVIIHRASGPPVRTCILVDKAKLGRGLGTGSVCFADGSVLRNKYKLLLNLGNKKIIKN
jgi:hypothetical protein